MLPVPDCFAASASRVLGVDRGTIRLLAVTHVDIGRISFVRLAGDSSVAGRVLIEALCFEMDANDVSDALEIESRIFWNLRFVVTKAVGILSKEVA